MNIYKFQEMYFFLGLIYLQNDEFCFMLSLKKNLSVYDFLPTLLHFMLLKSFLGVWEILVKNSTKNVRF